MKKEPNFVDKHVGSRVRMRRMLVGMSQEKLGEALGITFQQVQKYEKGTNRISASRLQQIASVLGVTISFFYEGLPAEVEGGGFAEESSPAFVMDFMASQDGLQLMESFMRIKNPRVRRTIVDHVKALAGDDSEDRSL
jgi:transcriptional regulator with XRE-family HTH domain